MRTTLSLLVAIAMWAGVARADVWDSKGWVMLGERQIDGRVDSAGDAPTLPPGQLWDNRGWTMLGERAVQGGRKADRDKITVGRNEGKFRKLMIVVTDSDLEMIDIDVKFARGRNFHPDVNTFFRENTRTRAIDLPGDDRVIKWIEFRYRNLPGGGRAKVQVWAK